MTDQDFRKHRANSMAGNESVIQEEFIIRRKMNIDQQFFTALMKFDQETVRNYFLEKLVLVRRDRGR